MLKVQILLAMKNYWLRMQKQTFKWSWNSFIELNIYIRDLIHFMNISGFPLVKFGFPLYPLTLSLTFYH